MDTNRHYPTKQFAEIEQYNRWATDRMNRGPLNYTEHPWVKRSNSIPRFHFQLPLRRRHTAHIRTDRVDGRI